MPDLSDGVNWSEIDANNNNAPPNGWPEGMMPSGVNDAARADRGAMKRFWDRVNPVQTVTPSGGVWTFTTSNTVYPTAYINGEVYRFRPGVAALGGDQFQVNALGPKPILKHLELFGFAGMVSVIAHDFRYDDVQLVYDASLGSAGAFVLLNPFVPISGDGAGGVSVPGNLAVAGDLTLAGSVAAVGGMTINGDLEVFGRVAANGYASRSGTAGPYQTNFWNIQWAGSAGAHLWIDTTDEGQIVTASAAGDIVITGAISAGSLTTTGAVSAGGALSTGGALSVTGNTTVTGNLTANNVTANGTLSVTGNISAASALSVTGNLTANNITANGTSGIYATAGPVRSDFTGLALNLPSGDIACRSVTATGTVNVSSNCLVGGNLYMGGASVATLGYGGNYVHLNAGDSEAALQACFIIGSAAEPTNYSRNGSHKFDNRSGSTTYAIFNGSPPYAYKPGGGTWGDSSDVRLKHQIEDYTSGLPEIEQLRPVRFRFNGRGGTTDDGTIFTGLVADEVRGVMPEMIGTLRARLDPGDELEVDLLTLDATSLIYALVNSVQELAGEISMVKKLLREMR